MNSRRIVMKMFLVVGLFCLSAWGCTIQYSFTGASIPADAKTFSVTYIENQAPIVQPTLSQMLTDALKDKLMSQTPLEEVYNDVGDLHFEGVIKNYSVSATAITGDETAAQNRLTVSVSVSFKNSKDPSQDFQQVFSQYEDWDSQVTLESEETGLNEVIVEKLVDDIFNKAVANW